MKLQRGHWLLLAFNLIYVFAYGIYYLSEKNYEFLWYVAILLFFILLIGLTLHRSKFDYVILWGLSIWGFLHMSGGGIRVGEGVLYTWHMLPIINSGDLIILKFDQFVHAFGFCIATLVGFHLIKPYLNEKTNYKVLYGLLILIGMGFGALNEVLEFIAVIAFSQTGVGGYYNTALDLVFNMVGAIIAVFIIHIRLKR